ncbi:unnamed protein product [Microthlaspi erraticum]|uniref:Uncharacterized protein n=1 Tax=Microthlaspi erraticum TaxID=1685480 RepID=A0A6D2K774_9BRAS|nr:unnamed protein product [Microthlaspi erraticum]
MTMTMPMNIMRLGYPALDLSCWDGLLKLDTDSKKAGGSSGDLLDIEAEKQSPAQPDITTNGNHLQRY